MLSRLLLQLVGAGFLGTGLTFFICLLDSNSVTDLMLAFGNTIAGAVVVSWRIVIYESRSLSLLQKRRLFIFAASTFLPTWFGTAGILFGCVIAGFFFGVRFNSSLFGNWIHLTNTQEICLLAILGGWVFFSLISGFDTLFYSKSEATTTSGHR